MVSLAEGVAVELEGEATAERGPGVDPFIPQKNGCKHQELQHVGTPLELLLLVPHFDVCFWFLVWYPLLPSFPPPRRLSPTNCHQPIATNQLSPTTCHQPMATNQTPPTNCHQKNCHQPIATNQLTPTNCHQPIAISQLSSTNCHQQSATKKKFTII